MADSVTWVHKSWVLCLWFWTKFHFLSGIPPCHWCVLQWYCGEDTALQTSCSWFRFNPYLYLWNITLKRHHLNIIFYVLPGLRLNTYLDTIPLRCLHLSYRELAVISGKLRKTDNGPSISDHDQCCLISFHSFTSVLRTWIASVPQ